MAEKNAFQIRRAGAAEHDDIRHVDEGDREIVVKASDVLAAVVTVNVIRVLKMLVETRDDKIPADVDETDKNEESDQEALVTISGEILENFLPCCETGADQERDKRTRELYHIEPANFVPTHKIARPFRNVKFLTSAPYHNFSH